MSKSTAIIWFRRDLRLADNPALLAACNHKHLLCVYIHAPEEEQPWQPGGAQRVWLHQSLCALDQALQKQGSRLIIRTGASLDNLQRLAKETGADAIYWNRLYEPATIARDKQIKAALSEDGFHVESHNAALLREPWQIETKTGTPYKVFTPFWRSLAAKQIAGPAPLPSALPSAGCRPDSVGIKALDLLPAISWDATIRSTWTPGEDGAHAALESFLDDSISEYDKARNYPARPATSTLSPHLHFGEIGPRQIWHRVHEFLGDENADTMSDDADRFLTEVGWREFAHHLLFHFPKTPQDPLDQRFTNFPWKKSPNNLQAWQRGETGIPMVDSGMRELWHTGWMHNRVRMVVASFLTKNLMLPWQCGAEWFWDTLVDADLASNTLGWQWVAGCGADAAPYFRIFNPALQGERFDKQGEYIRRWVPEIGKLPNKHLHRPWDAPQRVLHEAGITLGEDYPLPITDLKESRRAALAAFDQITNNKK